MPKGYEFDQVYPDTPRVAAGRLASELIPVVVDVHQHLTSAPDMPVGVSDIESKIRRRYHGVSRLAIEIALREASEARLLVFDEANNEVWPSIKAAV